MKGDGKAVIKGSVNLLGTVTAMLAVWLFGRSGRVVSFMKNEKVHLNIQGATFTIRGPWIVSAIRKPFSSLSVSFEIDGLHSFETTRDQVVYFVKTENGEWFVGDGNDKWAKIHQVAST